MAKFRKRPIVIEAEQYHIIGLQLPGVEINCNTGRHCACRGVSHIHTLEGPLVVAEGDWIITGVKGEKYPIKPDIFAATYEAVEA